MFKSLVAGIAALVLGVSPIVKGAGQAYASDMKSCNMGKSQYLLQTVPSKRGELEELTIITGDEYSINIRAYPAVGNIEVKAIGKCDKKCKEEAITALGICAFNDAESFKTRYPLLFSKIPSIVENMKNGMSIEEAVGLADVEEGDNYIVRKDSKGLERLLIPFGPSDTLVLATFDSEMGYGLRREGSTANTPEKAAKLRKVLEAVQRDKNASQRLRERLGEIQNYMEKDGAKLREAIGLSNNSHKKQLDAAGTVLAHVPKPEEYKRPEITAKVNNNLMPKVVLVGKDLVVVKEPEPKPRVQDSPIYKAAQRTLCVPSQTIDYLVTRFQDYDPNLVEEKACEAYNARKGKGLSADKYSLANDVRNLLSVAPTVAVYERPKHESIDIKVALPQKLAIAEPKPAERKEMAKFEQPKVEPAKPECVPAQTLAYIMTRFPDYDSRRVEEEACKVFKTRKDEGLSADKYSIVTELRKYLK